MKKGKRKLGFALTKTEEEEKIEAMKYTETGSIQLHGINRDGKKTSGQVKISKDGLRNSSGEVIVLKDYKLLKKIGQASLNEGVEIMCHKDNPKDRIVVKSIVIDPTKSKEILCEVQTLSACKSPQIIKLKNCFLEEKRIKLVLEFMDCGSLDGVVDFLYSIEETMSEETVAKISEQMLLGLQYVHDTLQTVHRDLKPANILVNSLGKIKIADFGTAGIKDTLNDEEKVGSEAYMSPERLLGKSYSYASDIWSFGIIVAYCLFGYFPFSLKDNSTAGNNMFGLLKIVQKEDFIDFSKIKCSDDAIDFIKKCCLQEPSERPTAKDLLQHPFITKNSKEGIKN
eukprot:gene10289-2706_t